SPVESRGAPADGGVGDRQEREDVYEGKPLSEVTYEDLVGFIELDRVEAEDLDYKQEWHDKHVRSVCAMANTAGGDLIVGVGERSDGATKTNRPDPGNVPGVEMKPRDLAQSVAAKVRARTRPSLAPEVKAIEVEGKPGRAVLVVRVAESPEAPHEVRLGPSPEIPVRRRDNTESAGVDDVERLLRRRDALRAPSARTVDIDFFQSRVRSPGDELPPIAAFWARPRLAAGLRFDLDHALDQKLERLFREHRLGDGGGETEFAPLGPGLAIERRGREDANAAVSRVEVREDGTIRGAWALPVTDDAGALAAGWRPPAGWSPDRGGEEGREERPWIRFNEIADGLVGASRFVAAAYGARRAAVEFELFFGLHRCPGYRVVVPELLRERPRGVEFDTAPFSSYAGRVPGHPMGHDPTYGNAHLRTEGEGFDAEPVEEDLLRLVRSASRSVGISAPDARLKHYLR
ncbi:MAG: ATP-binding protein, partial [Actinomycetota bacterium]|nr:ATP-binding protein [Actinomycetota bacterium]